MRQWLFCKDYSVQVVKEQIDNVVFGENVPIKKSSENGIPFVSKDRGTLVKDLLSVFYSDEELKSPPIVSYR